MTFLSLEKGEFYKKKGNDEYNKKNFSKAIFFYTEGIKGKCNDEELQAKLYSNRSIAYFYLGKVLFIFIFLSSSVVNTSPNIFPLVKTTKALVFVTAKDIRES